MSETIIQQVESKWMAELIRHFKSQFKGTWLPSHDLEHHQRVWQNACQICIDSGVQDEIFYQQLLLACFFHDLGMVYDTSSQHGKRSADLCRNFLEARHEKTDFNLGPLLEAIEFHDDKEYRIAFDRNPVYIYLSLADDLDAFGARGAYRYIEIYVLRGERIEDIPDLILVNAAGRYAKVMSLLELLSLDPEPFREKYSVLQAFMDRSSYRESPDTLVRWLFDEVISCRADPCVFFRNCRDLAQNRRISDYLMAVRKEL